MTVTATASPSLALAKYWGKLPGGVNLPATSSLAVTLAGLTTTTIVREADLSDRVRIDGVEEQPHAFERFFAAVRQLAAETPGSRILHFDVESTNSFPTAAGLASSSSGFAALAAATVKLSGIDDATPDKLSRLARLGSGSAARAVFGGFTEWRRGAEAATELAPPEHWPQLRVIAVIVHAGSKPISSRQAMERTRLTSPYFHAWTQDAEQTCARARQALLDRDLQQLGEAMRASYLRMFATMLAATPPVRYWSPATVAVLELAEALRADGIPVHETMDAGPQVKLVTTADHTQAVGTAVEETFSDYGWEPPAMIVSAPGPGARIASGAPVIGEPG